jgi:unsaturated pyranuronate lyase
MIENWRFNIRDAAQGLPRTLTDGVEARIFPGAKMTVSVVELAPGAASPTHNHPQEQWGFLMQGSAVRILGDEEADVSPGNFWHTPGDVPHSIIAGPQGAIVVDVFAPPREEYALGGGGFGSAEVDDAD